MGYSPRGCKESDMTEQLHTHTHTHTVFFAGESPWTGEPGGLQSMGSHLLLLENKDNGCNYCSHL